MEKVSTDPSDMKKAHPSGNGPQAVHPLVKGRWTEGVQSTNDAAGGEWCGRFAVSHPFQAPPGAALEGTPDEEIEGVVSAGSPTVGQIGGPQDRPHPHEDARPASELIEPHPPRGALGHALPASSENPTCRSSPCGTALSVATRLRKVARPSPWRLPTISRGRSPCPWPHRPRARGRPGT